MVRRFLYRRRLERRRVAAAVVLQTQIRRVLARRAAQRRLWAVVTLQVGRVECGRERVMAGRREKTLRL